MWPSADPYVMGSGGGGGKGVVIGKKRKAAAGGGGGGGERAAAVREPRRGLGVAELERIRVQLEAAQSLLMIPSLSTLPSPPPPTHVVPAAVRHHDHQHVGNNGSAAPRRDDHHGAPYYGSLTQHYYTNDALTRFLQAPSGSQIASLPRQTNVQGTDDRRSVLVSANAATPLPKQHRTSSSELQDYHGRATETAGRAGAPVPFVNLVDDSEDDDGDEEAAAGAGDELDLELKL